MKFEEFKAIIKECKSYVNEGVNFPDVTPVEFFEGTGFRRLPFIEIKKYLISKDIHDICEIRYEDQKRDVLIRSKENLPDSGDLREAYWNRYRGLFNESITDARELKRGYLKTLNEFAYHSYFDEGFLYIDKFFNCKTARKVYNEDKTKFIKGVTGILIGSYKDLRYKDHLCSRFDIFSTAFFKGMLQRVFEYEFIVQTLYQLEWESLYSIRENQIPPVEIPSYSECCYKEYDYDSIILEGTIIPNYMLKGDNYWETASTLYGTKPEYDDLVGVYQKLKTSREMLGLDPRYKNFSSFKRNKSRYDNRAKNGK